MVLMALATTLMATPLLALIAPPGTRPVTRPLPTATATAVVEGA
jgi:hypothetical protein